jgi:DtxR family Mn-dependent transcriptional regulator
MPPKVPSTATRGVEDYLQQIKGLEEDGTRCTATVLAQTMGVSLPSASEMLKRLASEAYLTRDKRGSVSLTPDGRALAHKILRRHRLVERLLTDVLGMDWHQVHGEAHQIEHTISSTVEEHLFESLGFPEYCPHGHPICAVDLRTLRPLDTVAEGEEVAVSQISEIRDELHSYFDQIGIVPGTILKALEVAPFEGPLTVQGDAGPVAIGREVAAHIQVCPPDESDWINRRAADIRVPQRT